ncbi:Na/Pi symporter [Iningainema tapete]|uniref:Na/Pi cotransporter family protein n=1 Tax=Iningainema tapete BLCC-T55 TaxID=2748662 RepID=A0A8J6XKQ7_9CYAN|nr:Na/Pi cotransporter family protein [Iningainema tapete BLCC-T55]
MFIAKRFNQKILKCLSVAFFVLTLIVYPAILKPDVPFAQSSVEMSANAQTTSNTRDIKLEIAQAPPPPASEEASEEKKDGVNFFKMAMGAVAGLVLFIYGVTKLSEGLEDLGTDRMKSLLSKWTTNRFAGVLTGAVATTLLESSSVTIIMVIAMVSAGVLTFVQSLGVVLGSNIGTAVGAQIISLNIELYVPILMFAGLLLLFVGRTGTQKNLGLILLGFGLMFYGLEAIDEAMKPFRNYQPFIDWMQTLGKNPLLGAIVGAIFTIIIQSSSATVAIVITLASSGLISLPAGIAIMLGAEVGTCADTLVATIGRGRPALRTGVFHLLFNLVSAILGILFAPLLVQLVLAISGGAGVGRQIANAQIIFNMIGVVVVIAFLPVIAQLLERLIPDAREERPLRTETVV